MEPTILYILLVCVALSICIGAAFAWRPPERACLDCGRQTAIQDRHCRHCGFNPTSG